MPSSPPPDDPPSGRRPRSASVDLPAVVLGLVTAALNLAVVVALYDRYDYPFADGVGLVVFVGTLVAFGFVPGFVSGHSRLVVPALGFLALLAGVAVAEVTTPAPVWGQLGGYTVVDGDPYALRWASRLYVFVALLLAGGVAEFGLRSGYGLADGRLRNLPALPFSRYVVAWVAGGFGALFGATMAILSTRMGANPPGIEFVIFASATLAVAVPLAALLYRGLVVPLACFLLLVPRPLASEVLVGSHSPLFVLLLGPMGVAFALAGAVEYYVRYRVGDGGGTVFVDDSAS